MAVRWAAVLSLILPLTAAWSPSLKHELTPHPPPPTTTTTPTPSAPTPTPTPTPVPTETAPTTPTAPDLSTHGQGWKLPQWAETTVLPDGLNYANPAICDKPETIILARQYSSLAWLAFNNHFHTPFDTWNVNDKKVVETVDGKKHTFQIVKRWVDCKDVFHPKDCTGADAGLWVNTDEKLIVVAVSGTKNWVGWVEDFTLKAVKCVPAEFEDTRKNVDCGSLHEGFTNQFHAFRRLGLFSDVLNSGYLQQGYSIGVTGESLGAAVATMVSVAMKNYLTANKLNPPFRTMLFGTPAVGDNKWVTYYSSIMYPDNDPSHVIRFNNYFKAQSCFDSTMKGAGDVVATFPFEKFGLGHIGTDCHTECPLQCHARCCDIVKLGWSILCHIPNQYPPTFLPGASLTSELKEGLKKMLAHK